MANQYLTDDQITEIIIEYNEIIDYYEKNGVVITEPLKNVLDDMPYITIAAAKEHDITKKYKTLTDFYNQFTEALRDMKDNNKKDKDKYEKIAQWCNMIAKICDNKLQKS
jgi:hypothetical protein